MPRITSAKWDRTLVLNIPIFIAIWLGLRAALEIHFRLIIRHRILGYRLNTYRLEVTGYSEYPWWREFYIDFELSRLQFGSRPIGPTGDGPSGWNDDGNEPPPHGERADHLPDPTEGRPPTPPRQPSSSSSNTDNNQVVVNQNRRTPEPIPPPRYYVSQHLNLLGANPTISSGSLQRAMKHPALNQRLKVSGSRPPRTVRFQMSWKTATFHHSPWHRDRDRHRHKSLMTYPVN